MHGHHVCLSGHPCQYYFCGIISHFFCFCLSMVLECFASFLMLINSWHSFRYSSLIIFSRSVLHVSHWQLNMVMVLLINLILSFNKTFSALPIIYWPLGVLMLLLSFILTGMTSSERHLRENLLWFLKSAILHSILSQHCSILTLSLPYSDLKCVWVFLILLVYYATRLFSQKQN